MEPHNTDDEDCWCEPEIVQTCPDCYQPEGVTRPECLRCGARGVVPVYFDGVKIIIHRGPCIGGKS